MLDYTRATVDRTITDVKRFAKLFTFGTQIFYILYLIYAMISGTGNIIVNAIMSALSVANLIITAFLYDKKDRLSKRVKRTTKRVYKWVKLSLQAFTLGATVYGIYIAASDFSAISIIFALFTAVMWAFSVMLQIISIAVEARLNLFKEALHADIQNVLKPINAVKDVFGKIVGKEPEEKPEPTHAHTKRMEMLEGMVIKFKERKKLEKEAKRLKKKGLSEEGVESREFAKK